LIAVFPLAAALSFFERAWPSSPIHEPSFLLTDYERFSSTHCWTTGRRFLDGDGGAPPAAPVALSAWMALMRYKQACLSSDSASAKPAAAAHSAAKSLATPTREGGAKERGGSGTGDSNRAGWEPVLGSGRFGRAAAGPALVSLEPWTGFLCDDSDSRKDLIALEFCYLKDNSHPNAPTAAAHKMRVAIARSISRMRLLWSRRGARPARRRRTPTPSRCSPGPAFRCSDCQDPGHR
jgi:hypothetical protein